MAVPNITLSGDYTMPQIGLGLWQVTDQAAFDEAFDAAVQAGYRHFDSAQAYNNEQFLGSAWTRSGLPRKELWITTKVRTQTIAVGDIAASIEQSLKNLQTDYVDLLLLHFPVPLRRKHGWKELESAVNAGKAHAIGVSNYTIKHLEEMAEYADIKPAVNQVELHVFLQQPELLEYCHDKGIVVEAYSPLAHAKAGADEPVLATIASKHGKTYAQIMLRWCIEKDLIVLPKSVTPSRIEQNIDIFDFALDADDMQHLSTLDRNMRTCWSPVNIP